MERMLSSVDAPTTVCKSEAPSPCWQHEHISALQVIQEETFLQVKPIPALCTAYRVTTSNILAYSSLGLFKAFFLVLTLKNKSSTWRGVVRVPSFGMLQHEPEWLCLSHQHTELPSLAFLVEQAAFSHQNTTPYKHRVRVEP